MNNLTFDSTALFVKNMKVAKSFYVDLLGMKIKHDFGESVSFDGGLSLWQISEKHLIKQVIKDTETNSTRAELYFETTDIDDIYNILEKHEIEFVHKIQEEPWGQKNFRFFDPDQHLIEIGESLSTFVKRLSKQGLSDKEVADKTGIPLVQVKTFIIE